ncbi:unnamed protein product [Urochloa humidicola]
MAMPPRPMHLAAISLVLLALLPHATVAEATTTSTMGPHRDAPLYSTARLDTSPVARRHAPSPQAAPPTTPARLDLPARAHAHAHAHAAARARVRRYGATLADLRSVCRAPRCFADPVHRLLLVLYGPHVRVGSDDDDDLYGFGVVRTIEGTRPILPRSAWRAYIYSGGDVCHVELGYMDYGAFYGAACPAWTCQAYFILSPEEALASTLRAIATPCGGMHYETRSAAATFPSPRNAVVLLPLLAAAATFFPPPVAAAVALSSLASRALATDLSDVEYYTKFNYAVYAYGNTTGADDRARPVPGLRGVCPRPLCIDAAESDTPTSRSGATAAAATRCASTAPCTPSRAPRRRPSSSPGRTPGAPTCPSRTQAPPRPLATTSATSSSRTWTTGRATTCVHPLPRRRPWRLPCRQARLRGGSACAMAMGPSGWGPMNECRAAAPQRETVTADGDVRSEIARPRWPATVLPSANDSAAKRLD